MQTKNKIGFIGQGWIGKNYALDFIDRGFDVVRYAKEPEYEGNKDALSLCDIIFIAVPTPTTPSGFDFSIIQSVLALVPKGATAVIKSTIIPGTTQFLQKMYPDIYVMHSPEFLTEVTARQDASHPERNIVGIPEQTDVYVRKAEEVLAVLPSAPFSKIMDSTAAEFIKYAGNNLFFAKVVFMNTLFDLATSYGLDWSVIKESLAADPRIGSTHLDPVHKTGRGAGGNCFIKDFKAFEDLYIEKVGDEKGVAFLEAMEAKNIELLKSTHKDLDLLQGVYGKEV